MTGGAPLALLPAVDIADGRADQVVGPVAGTQPMGAAAMSTDPETVARSWIAQGAERVHLVDLDRAFGRGPRAAGLLARLAAELAVPVQISGGITDDEALTWAAATAASRVVLASSALTDPGLIRRAHALLGERLVVAVDVREGRVVARGTDLDLGPVEQVLEQHPSLTGAGGGEQVAHVLVADAARDGRRSGVDVELFGSLAAQVGGRVIASGGVATLADLRALRRLTDVGVREVVLGAALYHGAFTLEQAVEVCR